MGTLEFSVKGLAEELRRRRDAKRGAALLTILLIASLLVLTNSRSPVPTGVDGGTNTGRGPGAGHGPGAGSDNGAQPPPQPAAQISPRQADFGSPAVGDSGHHSFTLTNVGTLRFAPKITLDPSSANAFSLKDQCATLEPEQECTIDVAFAPRASRKYSGRLIVVDESGHPLATATLSGAGQPQSPAFTANPASLSFSPQQIGTSSAAQTVVLRNARARQFFAGYNTALGTAGAHFRILNCQFLRYDKMGNPGDSCRLNVSFLPTTIGPHSDVLEIREMSAPGVPINNVILARITLEGSGTSAAIRVSPQQLDFSDPNGSSQRVVVQNVGNVAVTINAVPITGSDSNRFTANVSACQTQAIEPNLQCVITVAHLASPQQADNAELQIFHTAASAAETVRLMWKAPLLPKFAVRPTSLNFDVTPEGSKTSLQMTLTNVGAAPANSVVMVFMSADHSSFEIDDDSCSGRALAPQGRCTATLVFAPKKNGSLRTTLVVSDGGLKAMTPFSVTGQATRPVGEP